MSEPKKIMALDIDLPELEEMDERDRKYFNICIEKLGLLPNVLKAYSFDSAKLQGFVGLYNDLMLADSGLTQLEREMIAVVVSSLNRCYYCQVAHGQTVREISGDPIFGEKLLMNYRVAELSPRQRVMLDFSAKLTTNPELIEEHDREELRRNGFSDRDIWDIGAVASFFNMSNRMGSAVGMMPNEVYHSMNR